MARAVSGRDGSSSSVDALAGVGKAALFEGWIKGCAASDAAGDYAAGPPDQRVRECVGADVRVVFCLCQPVFSSF